MEKTLTLLEKYILYIVLFLLAIVVGFNNSSPFIIPKLILLVSGASLFVLIWVAKMFVDGKFTFRMGKFDLGVILLALTYITSTLLATPNKMEAYLLPGTTTFVVAGAVLYFLINQFDKSTKHNAKIAVLLSALFLGIASIFSSLNLFAKIPQLPEIVKDPTFNLLGGAVPSIIFLVSVLIMGVGILLKEKDFNRKVTWGVSLGVILFGLSILVFSALPGKATSPRFATTQTSWEVTVETLKKNPLLGIGPSNYLTAFNLFKPLEYNQSDLWQVRFTTASNYYFTLLTETGFLGLFAISILLISIYRFVRHDLKLYDDPDRINQNLEKLTLAVMVVLFALFPITPVLLVFLFIYLALFSDSEKKLLQMNIAGADTGSLVASRVPVIIAGLPFILAVLYIVFVGGKVLKAESIFAKSLNALSRNEAKTTYDLMVSAINYNPRVDRYHASFAQVNLALASSIAQKKDITDADRNTISQLVQQAISEGKATVALNPGRSGNWEVLAQIYRSIMPFAGGADQFAVQTYSQAIALDPTNPNLRIELGGIFYSLENFDNAIEVFKLAVLAKPDLANAHYNLAIAYREKKDYDNAITEMNNVLNLVDKSSQDYALAEKTLADLKSKKTNINAEAVTAESLAPPPTPEASNVNPPIILPEEATPPATPANP